MLDLNDPSSLELRSRDLANFGNNNSNNNSNNNISNNYSNKNSSNNNSSNNNSSSNSIEWDFGSNFLDVAIAEC